MLAFFSPGPMELAVIGGIALLLFGNKLPKVARSIGSSIVEFKKGIKGVTDEVDDIKKETRKVGQEIEAASEKE